MGRFVAVLVLALGLFAFAAYQFDLITIPGAPEPPSSAGGKKHPSKDAPRDVGALLFAVRKVDFVDPPVGKDRSVNAIRISGQLQPVDKVEISSTIEGQILTLGEEIPLAAQLVAGTAPFLLEPYKVAKFKYQELDRFTDKLQFVVREYSRIYRPLLKGQMVSKDQNLALLNPVKALSEIRAKQTKVDSAKAESRAAIATVKEARDNYERSIELRKNKVIAEYDFRIALLTFIRHQEEAVGKEQAVKAAELELEQAQLFLNQHDIRNQLPAGQSIIQEIFKERGEAVKPQDKIMELYSLERFIAEGLVDVQYLRHIERGMPVTIEPTQEESPLRRFAAHRAEITCVAVTKDAANPLVVSASEDRTVLVWERNKFGPLHYFAHPEPVRVVACSPPGSSHNLILAGGADGSIWVWNLDQPAAEARRVGGKDNAHRDAVTSLAFSPDGDYFASGSADAAIKLWNVGSGELMYPFAFDTGAASPHQGTITSLHFTPECQLVSASRDNSVRVWELHKKGVKMIGAPISGRSGAVTQLGVSADGRFMLFDQGKNLQLLSVDGGRTINTLQNFGESAQFETLAIFSPDSTLMLTAGASEGKLQLWSRPTGDSRAFEVRQLVTDERSIVTCAAFAPVADPKGSFAVSGTKDGFVYLWPVPSTEEVKNHRIEGVPLTTINPVLNVATRQIRIGVVVPNEFPRDYPNGRLISNRPVTIVIDPKTPQSAN